MHLSNLASCCIIQLPHPDYGGLLGVKFERGWDQSMYIRPEKYRNVLFSFLYFSGLMKVITASSKCCNKVFKAIRTISAVHVRISSLCY